ncbi:hypothetical protein HO173_000601 [Letharia columbiana]|uniref:NmrA-like domain-containing protein n=1 Tax=Letharia columbiana TaxID=112416 RepID=A0A8H6LB10_9LECA|nr:uncharacterized protein HO173_000601 [Letharia columbiana]KAF6241889.1 hypothetical protein HO173_000601 [Letharia columbiana]
MAAKKILVVFGATGNQGGSVIKSILSDPKTAGEFKIRAITRDPSKPNAQALTAKGAHAVFAVTNYWEKMDAELEMKQGRNIGNLAKECGVQHLIWSSLYDVAKLTGGKFPNVEHFDSKAAVEQHIRDIGVPATFLMPGFFMSNIPGGAFRQLPPSNHWTLALPMPADTPIPCFDAGSDTGKFVKGILTHREKVLGKRVLAATDYSTPSDAINIFKELFPKAGESAKFVQMSKDDYKGALAHAGMPEKVQQELYENMAFMNEYGYYGKSSLAESHEILDEKLTTLKEFFAGAKAFEGLE